MGVIRVAPKHARMCAFCEYWYDPTNSAIEPTDAPFMWKVLDEYQKSKCSKKCNLPMPAGAGCPNYKCKV